MHRYGRRRVADVIDWFDYKVAGAPYRRPPFRAWRRRHSWVGRVLLVLAVLAVVAFVMNRRNRRSFWI